MNICMRVNFPNRTRQTTEETINWNLLGAGLSQIPIEALPGHCAHSFLGRADPGSIHVLVEWNGVRASETSQDLRVRVQLFRVISV